MLCKKLDLMYFLNVWIDFWFKVTLADHSILVGLCIGMISFHMYPVWSQGLLVGPCLSISVMIPEHTYYITYLKVMQLV